MITTRAMPPTLGEMPAAAAGRKARDASACARKLDWAELALRSFFVLSAFLVFVAAWSDNGRWALTVR